MPTDISQAPRLLDLGGRRLAFQVQGEGPPVLLEMGAAGSGIGNHWNGVAERVAEFATVITYDRAGLGHSDPPPGRPTIIDMVDDLELLLAAVDLQEPLVIAGWSWGGLIAQHYAALRPEAVAGLVLIDPTPPVFKPPPLIARVLMPVIVGIQAAVFRSGLLRTKVGGKLVRAMVRSTGGPRLPEAMVDLMAAELAKPGTWGRLRLVTDRLLESCALTSALLAERGLPDVPLLLLSAGWRGKKPNAARTAEIATSHEQTVASVPRGKRILLDDISHSIPLEDPDAVVDAIRDVVTQVRISAGGA